MNQPKLYIQINDGLPINHPAIEENLLDAFGEIPSNWEPFIRVPNPCMENANLTLIYPDPVYKKVDGIWQDFWYYREKTQEEKDEEYNRIYGPIIEAWRNRPYANNFATWTLNEKTFQYEAPVPKPLNGAFYRWCGPENRWKLAEPMPRDGKHYYFDFDNWVNVEITDD